MMKINAVKEIFGLCLIALIGTSCDEKDLYAGYWVDELNDITKAYIYPFDSENQNVVAEIKIETDGTVDLEKVEVQIPHLRYNKEFIVMLTQDDCVQAAFCVTWAAINNRPLSTQYFYDYVHLLAKDLPPRVAPLGKTLGSTDGAGNEVRFSFTTTLAPEWEYMDAKSDVGLVQSNNYARFYRKSGLTWRNVIEMLNYDVGIAFHDVDTEDVFDVDSIVKHYEISQDIILDKLSGRGCKVLAEPNGNKTYVDAAANYAPIQALTAQAGAEIIKPFGEERDLSGVLQERWFIEQPDIRNGINELLTLDRQQMSTMHIGVHSTDMNWVNLLLWLNDTYGKDGADNVWMPSFEEYYEYNYNRVHSRIEKTIDGNTLTVRVALNGGQYFYFPATTINLTGLSKEHVVAVTPGSSVTGMSYNDFTSQSAEGGTGRNLMINVDCRRSLAEHAARYVAEYEKDPTDEALKADALYFTNRLKASETKTGLLNRIK